MPNLRDELRRCWHQCQADIPAAWRLALGDAEPNFGACENAALDSSARIVPLRREASGPFYALDGIDPGDVAVVVVGNDPYPNPRRATGRSFEQGDVVDWADGFAQARRVTRSLASLACAVAALHPDAAGLGLDGAGHSREILKRELRRGRALLPRPQSMFENLTGQGVLWINRTPTISARRTHMRWQAINAHRKWHRALWCPITRAILSAAVGEARTRPVVFALFGDSAGELQPEIEMQGQALDVPASNLRFVRAGHPSRRQDFFCAGNPLGRINSELASLGRTAIDWCDPAAIPPTGSVGNGNPARGGGGAVAMRATGNRLGASVRSLAIMDRAVGKYRNMLRRLAER